jgi:hypothetical protein
MKTIVCFLGLGLLGYTGCGSAPAPDASLPYATSATADAPDLYGKWLASPYADDTAGFEFVDRHKLISITRLRGREHRFEMVYNLIERDGAWLVESGPAGGSEMTTMPIVRVGSRFLYPALAPDGHIRDKIVGKWKWEGARRQVHTNHSQPLAFQYEFRPGGTATSPSISQGGNGDFRYEQVLTRDVPQDSWQFRYGDSRGEVWDLVENNGERHLGRSYVRTF